MLLRLTACTYFSYYRSRVQESEGIVQDALGRLTCLEVLLCTTNLTPCIFCVVLAVVVIGLQPPSSLAHRVQLSSEKNEYGNTTACSTTSTT